MKYCPKCGTGTVDVATYCHSCGFYLGSPVEETEPETEIGTTHDFIEHQRPSEANSFEWEVSETPVTKHGFLQTVIQLLIKPREEWTLISREHPGWKESLKRYVLILLIIPAVFSFLTDLFYDDPFTLSHSVRDSLLQYVAFVGLVFGAAYLVDLLAPSFETEKDYKRSFQLISYAFTPVWVLSMLTVVPYARYIVSLGGYIFAAYLLNIGIVALKKTPEDKSLGYSILVVLSSMIAYSIGFKILQIVF